MIIVIDNTTYAPFDRKPINANSLEIFYFHGKFYFLEQFSTAKQMLHGPFKIDG